MVDIIVMKSAEEEAFDMDDLENMTLDQFKKWVAEMIEEWPHPDAALSLREHYEGGYVGANWKWDVPETDEERTGRLQREQSYQQQQERQDRYLLAALKAKYER